MFKYLLDPILIPAQYATIAVAFAVVLAVVALCIAFRDTATFEDLHAENAQLLDDNEHLQRCLALALTTKAAPAAEACGCDSGTLTPFDDELPVFDPYRRRDEQALRVIGTR